jgi:starvation-inducible DNA-binding protein
MLQDTMKTILANTVALKYKAQGYHWNVKGMLFPQLHDFFGDLYQEFEGAIDPTAEEIRTLGIDAPAGLSEFVALRTIADGTATTPVDMIMDLYQSNAEMINLLTRAFDESNAVKKYGMNDFLGGRIDAHEKHAWMLRSIASGVGVREEVEQSIADINEKYSFDSWNKARRNK